MKDDFIPIGMKMSEISRYEIRKNAIVFYMKCHQIVATVWCSEGGLEHKVFHSF